MLRRQAADRCALRTASRIRVPAMSQAAARTAALDLARAPRFVDVDGTVRALVHKDALLLAMLVLDGPAPRSRVATQLWPDADPEGARNNLRQRLFRLRRTAARDSPADDGCVATMGHDLEPPAGRPAKRRSRGELLGGLDYADCAELGDWVDAARERGAPRARSALGAIADSSRPPRTRAGARLCRASARRRPAGRAGHAA